MPNHAPRSSTTIEDVARIAGVSRSTAARALGGYGPVSERVRSRVRAAAEQLEYAPNALARNMRAGSTRTLGVIVGDVGNYFFSEVLKGISDVARSKGFELLLGNSDEDPMIEKGIVETFLQMRVDGLIIAPASVDQEDHLSRVLGLGVPLVQYDRVVPGLDADAVTVDNQSAARGAVQMLAARGHRRIAFLSGVGRFQQDVPLSVPRGRRRMPSNIADRIRGYVTALKDTGLGIDDSLIAVGDLRGHFGRDAIERLLSLDDPPTAIITSDSVILLGAVEGLRALGVKIPSEVSILTFDDPAWLALFETPITAIAQPSVRLGATAAEQLIARIQGTDGPCVRRVLKTQLHVRASTTEMLV